MKNVIKYLSVITACVFILLATACSVSNKNMTVEKGQIPPDFKKYKGTLLILKQEKNWNRFANKYFTANYTGKFLMIDKKDLESYSDKDAYRYTLGRDVQLMPTQIAGKQENTIGSESLCVTDRQIDKKYCTGEYEMFGKLLKTYSATLESERHK